MKSLMFPIAMIFLAATGLAAAPVPAAAQEISAEMRELRDRAAIHQLLMDYGRTLDQRDFGAFADLFTQDGEYGAAASMARGPADIAGRMRAVFEANAMGFRDPNFHVFFNESIRLDGDRAESTSMSFYVVPGADNLPEIAMMAEYEDELVRAGGVWKFQRREVRGLMPVRSGE